ncbi:malonic semialdehyde reductase [Iodidimonas sp. SYSU 1G8]|uniref:malonic semialdehyde reductase n=1 Tax=Iodidimonas sp. SYSU 1G8 TaxID=3133967 RepID=UPI0031FEEA22
MSATLSDEHLDTIFRAARTQNKWLPKPVSAEQLVAIYDLMKWGPTSANCFPMRLVFAHSQAEKDQLATMVSPGNVEKVKTAGAVAIIGHDMKFYDQIPRLFPHAPEAREWFANDEQVAATTAFRNGTLQGAYLMIAARALGLDTGPMSGFNNAAVDAAYFAGTDVRSNFLCAIGYGDPDGLFPRSPRPDFAEMCDIR